MDICACELLKRYIAQNERTETAVKVGTAVVLYIVWRQHKKIASLDKRLREIEMKED